MSAYKMSDLLAFSSARRHKLPMRSNCRKEKMPRVLCFSHVVTRRHRLSASGTIEPSADRQLIKFLHLWEIQTSCSYIVAMNQLNEITLQIDRNNSNRHPQSHTQPLVKREFVTQNVNGLFTIQKMGEEMKPSRMSTWLIALHFVSTMFVPTPDSSSRRNHSSIGRSDLKSQRSPLLSDLRFSSKCEQINEFAAASSSTYLMECNGVCEMVRIQFALGILVSVNATFECAENKLFTSMSN